MDIRLLTIFVALLALLADNTNKCKYLVLAQDHFNPPALNLSALLDEPAQELYQHVAPELGWTGPRPDPMGDDDWNRFVCKGNKMVAQMSYSDYDVGQMLPVPQTTAQSPWGFEHLWQWGYTMSSVDEPYRNFEAGRFWGIASLLRGARISDKCVEEGGSWHASVIRHWDYKLPVDFHYQTYESPEGSKVWTGAFFYMAVSPDGGMMAQNRIGPREAAKEEYPPTFPFRETDLPKLQKSSDMMWCMWEHHIPADKIQNVKFFFSLTITNDETLAIISRALYAVGKDIDRTQKFTMDTDEGKAILASPNGAGFAHFLIQRKNQIGLKTIEAVYVFECASQSRAPCLLFFVKSLAAPVPVPEPNGNSASELLPRQFEDSRHIIREHVVHMDGRQAISV